MNFRPRKSLLILGTALMLSSSAFSERITLWEHGKDNEQKVIDKIIAKFEAAHKGDRVKRAHYKTEDLRTQFQTAALGGGGADIVLAPNDFAGTFSIMGIIKPVNDIVDPKQFTAFAVQGVTDPQGKIWGVPVSSGNHLMLFVNKQMVARTPKTLEELVKTAKRVSNPKTKTYGFAYNLNEPFWFVTFLSAYGEHPLVAAKPALESEGMVKALEFVHSMKFKDKIVPSDCDYSCADNLFVDQKAAMIINGDWAIQKYQKSLGKNLAIVPLPTLAATGKPMQPMVSGIYVFFNRRLKGKKLEVAKRFAKFLTSAEIQKFTAQEIGRLPAVKNADVETTIMRDPLLAASQKALKNGQPMPMEVEMRAVWDAIRPQLQGVMAGRTKAQIAAKSMQKDAETKIKEMKQ